jgi:hypothetical protein
MDKAKRDNLRALAAAVGIRNWKRADQCVKAKPYIIAVTSGRGNPPVSCFVVGGTPTGGGPHWPAGVSVDLPAIAAFIAAADPDEVTSLLDHADAVDAELRRLRERLESIEGVATALLGAMRKVNVTEGLDEIERLQGIEKAAMWVLHEHPQPSWPAMNDLRAALGEAAKAVSGTMWAETTRRNWYHALRWGAIYGTKDYRRAYCDAIVLPRGEPVAESEVDPVRRCPRCLKRLASEAAK